jgi:alpha-acetolactate decarboxylase
MMHACMLAGQHSCMNALMLGMYEGGKAITAKAC